MLSKTLSVLAVGVMVASATPIPKHQDGQQCVLAGRHGIYRNGLCVDAKLDVDVDVHKRSLVSPFHLGHAYPDRTPCWVQGRRGWVKDQTCTDLIDVDASISVGKRHHSFDDPYFADGTPCFHRGREGIVQDLLCVDLDIDVGDRYPDSDYYGPWLFSHPYSEGRPCWVDNRRGWVHDGSCGNLLDIDTDILISKRFYKDDPYYVNGVPCVKDGKEGVMTDYICIIADVKIDARAYRNGVVDGERCWQRGRQGVVDGLLCVVADVSIGKRGIVGPHDGDACLHDGRWGRYHGDLCLDLDVDIDTNVDVKARGFVTGGPLGSRNPYTPHQGRPVYPIDFSHYREDGDISVDADVDVDVKRDIKSDTDVKVDLHNGHRGWRHGSGDGKGNAVDVKADVDVHGRSGHRGDRHHHDVLDVDANVKADVDIHRRSGHGGNPHHHHDVIDVDADVKADVNVDVHRRALNHFEHDTVDVDVDAETEVEIEARGGDAVLLGSVVSNSVKNFGRVVDNALEGKGKRDLLGLGLGGKNDDNDELLDIDLTSTLGLTDKHGHGHGHSILGGILRARSGSLMPRSLLKSLGLGRKGGASKAKSTSASGGILGISRLLGGKAL